MARTIEQIQQIMLDEKTATPELSALQVLTTSEKSTLDLTSESKLAIWRQMIWIVAYCILVFEQILDVFKKDVEERIAATSPHTRNWYREKALAFQYGHLLVPETDYYDNTGLPEEQVAASKIVANAAPVKQILSGAGVLRLKAVTSSGEGEWAPLSPQQLTALTDYMNDVSDAGTTVIVTSNEADDLKLSVDVYYNPQILSPTGAMLDGSNENPVLMSIKQYLKSLEFNGSLIISHLEDILNKLPGVEVSQVREAASKYAGYNYSDTGANIGVFTQVRIADAGWMKLDEGTTIINYFIFEN